MNIILLLMGLITLVQCSDPLYEKFSKFKVQFGKSYGSPLENMYRFSVFSENYNKALLFNQQGDYPFKLGVNSLSDQTAQEMSKRMGFKLPKGYNKPYFKIPKTKSEARSNSSIPSAWDWRTKGAVGAVHDQGKCGSCWTFSSTGALESADFIHGSKNLTNLSEQQLLDCVGNNTCEEGGFMEDAYKYLQTSGGIDRDECYPYTGAKSSTCRYNNNKTCNWANGNLTGYKNVENSDQALAEAIYNNGPISVALDANGLQSYTSGIYINPFCINSMPNHAVLAVGYGSENGWDYWIIKNSWGEKWGEKGYFRITRSSFLDCGVTGFASYPII